MPPLLKIENANNGGFHLEFPNINGCGRLHDCPGLKTRLVGNTMHYLVPPTPEAVAFLKPILRDVADPPASVRKRMKDLATYSSPLLQLSRAEDSSFQVPMRLDPYAFQRAGIEYALKAKRTFIADDTGLGKTAQALGVYEAVGGGMTVLCPSSVKVNWAKEALTFLTEVESVSIIEGYAAEREEDIYVNTKWGKQAVRVNDFSAEIVICNYAISYKRWQALKKRGDKVFVADESHYLKSKDAKRTQVALEVAGPSEYRLLLSATPAPNQPAEFWPQLAILGLAGEGTPFGTRTEFIKRWHTFYRPDTKYGEWIGKPRNLTTLNKELRSRCFVRRTKDQVLKDLPRLTYNEIPIEIDNRAEYDKAADAPAEFIYEAAKSDPEIWKEVRYLLNEGKAWDAEREVENMARQKKYRAQSQEDLVRLGLLKGLAAKGKLNACTKWIKDFVQSGEKLVVFAVNRSAQKHLYEKITKFATTAHIFGTDSAAQRQGQIERFQDGGAQVIVCSLYAAAEGITLTAAHDVAFVQYPWNPARLYQAASRVHRIGQEADRVTAHHLIARDTIEEYMLEVINRKAEHITKAVDGYEDKPFSTADLLRNL